MITFKDIDKWFGFEIYVDIDLTTLILGTIIFILFILSNRVWERRWPSIERRAPIASFLPRPRPRPRALTIPLPRDTKRRRSFLSSLWGATKASRQDTSEQLRCSLLQKLPLEIRRQIYREFLGGNVVHVFCPRNRLFHTRWVVRDVPSDPELDQFKNTGDGDDLLDAIRMRWDRYCGLWGQAICRLRMVNENQIAAEPDETRGVGKDGWGPRGPLPLLRTCRQIYSEAVDMLYAENDFQMDDFDTMNFFIAKVPLQRLSQIRSLELSLFENRNPRYGRSCVQVYRMNVLDPRVLKVWSSVWKTIGTMTKLRRLNVRIFASGHSPDREAIMRMITAMQQTQHVREFIVWTNLPLAKFLPNLEDMPFRISKKRMPDFYI